MRPETQDSSAPRPATPWRRRGGFAAGLLLTIALAIAVYRSFPETGDAGRIPPAATAEPGARVERLLRSGETAEARRQWTALQDAAGIVDEEFDDRRNDLWNGDFEHPLSGGALGWRTPEAGAVSAARVISGKRGGRVLRIEVAGEAAGSCGIRQQVVVDPGARYLLSFSARSETLELGGGVRLEVAESATGEILYASLPISGTAAWQGFLGSLEVPASSSLLTVRACGVEDGAGGRSASGRLWLDSVVLQKVAS